MTGQLNQAIQIAQSLSPAEQLELLQAIAGMLQKLNTLERQNRLFGNAHSIEDLIEEQQPPVVHDLKSLSVDSWNEDEQNSEFLKFLQQQRSVKLETGELEANA